MADFVICLKNELYSIPKSRKPQVQREINELNQKIDEYKALILKTWIYKRN